MALMMTLKYLPGVTVIFSPFVIKIKDHEG